MGCSFSILSFFHAYTKALAKISHQGSQMNAHRRERMAERGSCASSAPGADDSERFDRLRQILSTFNHRCRNSLNGIKMSLYLFKRGADGPMPHGWCELERAYREIERSFDRLQVIYRPLAMSFVRSPLGQLIAERLPSWRSWFVSNDRSLEIDPPDHDPPGDFDPIYLGLGLDAFVAWRAEAGSPGVRPRLSWWTSGGSFHIAWHEDCPGADESEDSELPNAAGSPIFATGDSLALPLLARVVAAHGGRLERTRTHPVGITLSWPHLHIREHSA
jgi:hypothetical protein